jgi:uncharacterized delta-60 repeat protein
MSASGIMRRPSAAFLVSILLLAPVAMPAVADAGQAGLDPSYGAGGWSLTPPGTLQGASGRVQIGVEPDGGAFVAGSGNSIVRLGPEGSLDQGFGGTGELFFGADPAAEGIGARSFSPTDIAVDGQGRLLVFGGESDSRRTFNFNLVSGGPVPASSALVLRYGETGQLDPTFGGGRGYVRGGLGIGAGGPSSEGSSPPDTLVEALAGTVDSKDRPVLVAGVGSVLGGCQGHAGFAFSPRAVVRLTDSGGREPDFGTDGKSPVAGTARFPVVGTESAGGVVAEVGPSRSGVSRCRHETTLVRLGATGSRLATFGKHGALRLGKFHLALVEPSGASIVYRYQGRELDLERIGATGRRSRNFGRHGLASLRLPAGADFGVRPVAVDGSGRILLAGYTGGRHSSFVVGRVRANGKPDAGLGEGGWLTSPVPDSFEIGSLAAALDPAGRLLVAAAGARPGESKNSYLVARFLLG